MNESNHREAAALTPVEVRRNLVEALELDLVGPGPGHELADERLSFAEPPSKWYLTGFLIPADTPSELRASDDEEDDDDLDEVQDRAGLAEESTEDRKAAKKAFFPSSMGLSFQTAASTAAPACRCVDRVDRHRVAVPADEVAASGSPSAGATTPTPRGSKDRKIAARTGAERREKRRSRWNSGTPRARRFATSRRRAGSGSTSNRDSRPGSRASRRARGRSRPSWSTTGTPPGRSTNAKPPTPSRRNSKCAASAPSCPARTRARPRPAIGTSRSRPCTTPTLPDTPRATTSRPTGTSIMTAIAGWSGPPGCRPPRSRRRRPSNPRASTCRWTGSASWPRPPRRKTRSNR